MALILERNAQYYVEYRSFSDFFFSETGEYRHFGIQPSVHYWKWFRSVSEGIWGTGDVWSVDGLIHSVASLPQGLKGNFRFSWKKTSGLYGWDDYLAGRPFARDLENLLSQNTRLLRWKVQYTPLGLSLCARGCSKRQYIFVRQKAIQKFIQFRTN